MSDYWANRQHAEHAAEVASYKRRVDTLERLVADLCRWGNVTDSNRELSDEFILEARKKGPIPEFR